MTAVELAIVGSGDAFSSGGRLQSGILISTPECGLLLDCGSTLLAGLERCRLTTDQIDAVAISHLHGDHFGGLPFLLLDALFVRKRTRPLTLFGPPGLEERLKELCDALYPGTLNGPLPFELSCLTLTPDQAQPTKNFTLWAFPALHGQQPCLSLRVEIAGRTISYTGDTEWTDALPSLASNCDLLICECCSYADTLPGHLDYQTLVKHTADLSARRILLTHTGPTIDSNRSKISFEVAEDGLRLQL